MSSLGWAERRRENSLTSARLGRPGDPSAASVCTSVRIVTSSGGRCPLNPNKIKLFSFKPNLVHSVDMPWGSWAKALQWVQGEALTLLFQEETGSKKTIFPAQMGWCIPKVTL